MKQVKFLLVALMAAVMGLSVSSCLNGENDPTRQGYTVAKVTNNSISTISLITYDGYTLNSKEYFSGLSDVYRDDFVYLAYSYNSETDIDPTRNVINITISAAQKVSGNVVTGILKDSDDESYKSDKPIVTISDGNLSPIMFDNYNLVLPIQYYAKDDLAKHTFKLVYYTDKLKGDNNGEDKNNGLTLFLRHNSSETNESIPVFSYKTFNLLSALEAYKEKYSSYPATIYIETEKSTSTDGVIPSTTTPVSISYTHK